MWLSVFSISIGAALGAILRWVLSERLNHVFPFLPPGTLTANLVGGYLIGVALMVFASLPNLSVEWRLFVITGFLGALTTFSTFSAEMFGLIQSGRLGWAFTGIVTHVAGSLFMTALGIATVVLIKQLKGF